MWSRAAFARPGTGSDQRPADRRGDRRPYLGRPLRPRPHRHLRHSGRDHQNDRRPAQGQAAAGGEEGDRAGADRECRGLHALSERPPILPHGDQIVHDAGPADVCQGGGTGSALSRAPMPAWRIAIRGSIPSTASTISADEILATAGKALAIDPNLAEAHAARGYALMIGDRRAEAASAFEQALALDPNCYEANQLYAEFCVTEGDFERAAQHYLRAHGDSARRLSVAAFPRSKSFSLSGSLRKRQDMRGLD